MAENSRIEELKRRVRLDPASIAFAALAEEYRRAGDYEQAVETCITGLQRHPAYLSARVTLGRALVELGRHDEAREHLEQVLRLAPENLAAIRALADLHHRRHTETRESAEHHEVEHTDADEQRAAAVDPAPSVPAVEESPEPPPAPAQSVMTPPPTPIRPVRLSTMESFELETSGSPVPAAGESAGPEAAGVPPPIQVQFQASMARRPSHPDESALPALEAFHAALVRARVLTTASRAPLH